MPNVEFQGDLTYHKGIIVAVQLIESTIYRIRGHQGAECPLVDPSCAGVSLEEFWGDKGIQHKPSTNVDTYEWTRYQDSSKNAMKRW